MFIVKSRIAIVWELISYGGVQTCVIVLIQKLNALGITPTLICRTKPSDFILNEFNLRIDYQIVHYQFEKFTKYIPVYIMDLFVYLDLSSLNYDFYYIFDSNVIPAKNQKYLFYLSMSPLFKRSVFHSFRNKVKMLIYNFTRFIVPKFEFSKIASNCVINSEFTAEIFFNNYSKKIDVVYPPSLIQRIDMDSLLKKDFNNEIVVLSRFEWQKRYHVVLDLAVKFPNYNFNFIGSVTDWDYYNTILGTVRDLGLFNVRFSINSTHKELMKIIDNSTFYVFAAQNEHFGITTLDIMRRGLIPFVHDSGGQKSIVSMDELRFNDDNMVDKFNGILKLALEDLTSLRMKLFSNLDRFDNIHFQNYLTEKITASE